jgi:hypothetical protein
MEHPVIESRGYLRGGFGEEMDLACLAITSHFVALPGWEESRIDPHEVAYLAGFFAFIALASSPSAPLGVAEAATGAKATVARRLMMRGTTAESLTACIRSYKARLNKYSALWVGMLKSENSFGAFSLLAFENVQTGRKTRDGYAEHLNTFPDFCERTIQAFYAAGQSGNSGTTALPTSLFGIKELARETEALLAGALRSLEEVGGADAWSASPANRAGHEEALVQVRRAQERLERLRALLDTLESDARP